MVAGTVARVVDGGGLKADYDVVAVSKTMADRVLAARLLVAAGRGDLPPGVTVGGVLATVAAWVMRVDVGSGKG